MINVHLSGFYKRDKMLRNKELCVRQFLSRRYMARFCEGGNSSNFAIKTTELVLAPGLSARKRHIHGVFRHSAICERNGYGIIMGNGFHYWN